MLCTVEFQQASKIYQSLFIMTSFFGKTLSSSYLVMLCFCVQYSPFLSKSGPQYSDSIWDRLVLKGIK